MLLDHKKLFQTGKLHLFYLLVNVVIIVYYAVRQHIQNMITDTQSTKQHANLLVTTSEYRVYEATGPAADRGSQLLTLLPLHLHAIALPLVVQLR